MFNHVPYIDYTSPVGVFGIGHLTEAGRALILLWIVDLGVGFGTLQRYGFGSFREEACQLLGRVCGLYAPGKQSRLVWFFRFFFAVMTVCMLLYVGHYHL